jgi:serine/threonine protein kinase
MDAEDLEIFSFICFHSDSDAAGKFQHGQIVIDDSGLKKAEETDDTTLNLKADDLEVRFESLGFQTLISISTHFVFQLLEILGKGTSSYVQKARNRITGQLMALKVINVFEKDKRHQLMKEIRTLHQVCTIYFFSQMYHFDLIFVRAQQASCPHLVSFYGAFFKEGQISIGLELMDAGSLHDILAQAGPFPEAALARISKQVCSFFDVLVQSSVV